ncbi:hypothetical protein C7293_20040 [filamentous cyanobacterium CCT1]|nr:hypothetical protein C7293_20040 [filamentous cyanobacterium CCT1]PSN77357.1 hypothetical protein C8B47_22465 [filamentous cyanobacterium CCP4]
MAVLQRRLNQRYWLALLLLMAAGLLMHSSFWSIPADDLIGEDIYYIWLEGKRIIAGENPYARVLASDMRANDKYATYFPLAYLVSALVQKLGLPTFLNWLYLWRPLSFSFHMGIVALTLKFFCRRGLWLLGFVAAAILLLGRWSLYITRVHHLEFAAIFFLLLSLMLLQSKPRSALLAFSLSLGIKQIAIFLLPLYLIYLWINGDKRIKDVLLGFLIILSVPVLTSLPFLIWNAEGFFKSIMFSATRLGSLHIDGAPSLDIILSQNLPWLVGLKAKLLMLSLMGLIYLSFWREKVGIFASAALVMMVFLYFNSVLFLQYFLWPLSVTLLALVERMPPLMPQRHPLLAERSNV